MFIYLYYIIYLCSLYGFELGNHIYFLLNKYLKL